jgi:hypothetical protein
MYRLLATHGEHTRLFKGPDSLEIRHYGNKGKEQPQQLRSKKAAGTTTRGAVLTKCMLLQHV